MAHEEVTQVSENARLGELAPRLALAGAVAGVVGVAAAVLLWLVTGQAEPLFRGYVMNLAFFTSIALGALFFVNLQHLTRAGWSVVVRRTAENITTSFVILALASIPLVVALLLDWKVAHQVYPWTDRELVAADPLLIGKAGYLNVPFFVIRLAVYFALWIGLSHFFRSLSIEQDATGDPGLTSRMQALSAPAMLVFALTTTFFAFDVLMSLDPHWFSTIFGVYFFSGGNLGAFAAMILSLAVLQRSRRVMRSVQIDHYHDLGKLLFAFVVFWAYIGYSQYMLIWYANLPEETGWYVIRQQQPWLWLSLFLLFGHFMLPFAYLIWRSSKRRKSALIFGAAWVLVVHWFDAMWLTLPHHAGHGGALQAYRPGPVDMAQAAALLLGMGGLTIWWVAGRMAQASLVPTRDPRMAESLAFENY